MLKNKGKILNKNKEDTMIPTKEHYTSSITEGEDVEIEDVPETEFRKLIVILFGNNQKQIQDLNEKCS